MSAGYIQGGRSVKVQQECIERMVCTRPDSSRAGNLDAHLGIRSPKRVPGVSLGSFLLVNGTLGLLCLLHSLSPHELRNM
jgi:hypothetical protein